MGDGSTAQTRFIGEDSPFEAHQDHLGQSASGGRFAREGIGKDAAEGFRQGADVGQQDDQAGQHVGNGHEWHHRGGDLGNPTHAADDHGKHQNAEDNSCVGTWNAEGQQSTRYLKALNAIADPEPGEHAEESEQASKPHPARAEPIADVIHRSTHVVAQFIHLAVVNSEHRLGVFGRDSKEGDQPHPEHGTGSTDGNRCGHPGDVAGAHRCRQRRHQGLEWRDVTLTRLVRLGQHHAHAIGKTQDRHEPQTDHQQDAGEGDQQDRGPAPGEGIDWIIDGRDQTIQARRGLRKNNHHSASRSVNWNT